MHSTVELNSWLSGLGAQFFQKNSNPLFFSEISIDSRNVKTESVFVAIRGEKFDSHTVLAEVCKKTPSALVVEDRKGIPEAYEGFVALVPSTRSALARLSHKFYGEPSSSLFSVGVTGTNGKTTTTHIVEFLLNANGWPCGVIGTIDHHLQNHVWSTQLTTPGPLELHLRFRQMLDKGAKALAFEVSSHALDQRRVDEVAFDVGVFTNLTRDHLDYHLTMENYGQSKNRLFSELLHGSRKQKRFAVVNGDDPWCKKMPRPADVTWWTFGQGDCNWQFNFQKGDYSGFVCDLKSPLGNMKLKIPLIGEHNLYNAVGALAAVSPSGFSLSSLAQALEKFPGVRGRLESIPNNRGLHVYVDYAHTDDALRRVIEVLKHMRLHLGLENKIIVVFGCGGDRDKGKRPLMAQAALSADLVVVTSDNPRNEDPEEIIADILTAVPESLKDRQVFVEIERSVAIGKAIDLAKRGDVVLIAGKGHESYQQIGDRKIPFSDQTVVQELLK